MGQSPDGSTYSEKPKDYILVQGNSDIKDGWVEPRLWTTQMTKKASPCNVTLLFNNECSCTGWFYGKNRI